MKAGIKHSIIARLRSSLAITVISLLSVGLIPQSYAIPANPYFHPYFGGTVGYGTSTWEYLVPNRPGAGINLSTPTSVQEGGGAWGVFGGIELLPQFAVEADYQHYPRATLNFDPIYSMFSFDHDGETVLVTHTETVSIQAKLMLPIPKHERLRLYSSFGVGGIHRYDAIVDRWKVTPGFGFGANYTFNSHIMLELGAEYLAGYGQSDLNPAEHFIPFLYSVFLRFAYKV
jgi:hypothetical protein